MCAVELAVFLPARCLSLTLEVRFKQIFQQVAEQSQECQSCSGSHALFSPLTLLCTLSLPSEPVSATCKQNLPLIPGSLGSSSVPLLSRVMCRMPYHIQLSQLPVLW